MYKNKRLCWVTEGDVGSAKIKGRICDFTIIISEDRDGDFLRYSVAVPVLDYGNVVGYPLKFECQLVGSGKIDFKSIEKARDVAKKLAINFVRENFIHPVDLALKLSFSDLDELGAKGEDE